MVRVPDLEGIKTLDPNGFFSPEEAARLLGMTGNGLRARIKRGQIKAGRNGKRYFIKGEDIQSQLIMADL